MINTDSYTLKYNDDIDSLSDSSFIIEESVKLAANIIKKESLHVTGSFHDNEWVFYANKLNTGQIRNFKFNKLDLYNKKHHIPKNFKVIVKCWLADLISKYQISTAQGNYSKLLNFLKYTNGFQPLKIDEFFNWFEKTDSISNKEKQNTILVTLNFLDYSDLNIGDIYIKPLIELRNKIPNKKSSRVLPPSAEILSFSKSIDLFYNDVINSSDNNLKHLNDKYTYYPIVIWWKLTTIIPLRPGEFCAIKRDCIYKNKDGYFLYLPRHKYPKKHPNVLDKVKIDINTYELISKYIMETNQFGDTETLISYNSILQTSSAYIYNIRLNQKKNIKVFNHNQLSLFINQFYERIMKNKYGFYTLDEHKLKPNDTRHLAIFSLMMQGVSPVEIARLANHKTISMQLNYSSHTEYWIDSQVFELLQNFKFSNAKENTSNNALQLTPHMPDNVLLRAFKPPTTQNYYMPLKDIGYCSDEQQRCETEECIYCSHWRVSVKELNEKKSLIKTKLANSKKNVYELIEFLKNIHSLILSDELEMMNFTNFNNLKSTSFQLKESLKEITNLKLMEVQNVEEKSRS